MGSRLSKRLLFLNRPLLLKAKDVFLSPENDTIGILVSTAVEISVGGKTIKPAGGLWKGGARGEQGGSATRKWATSNNRPRLSPVSALSGWSEAGPRGLDG